MKYSCARTFVILREMEFKVCRICLNSNATLSVFDVHGELQYSAKMMRCVNVAIAEGDGLPDALCTGCAAELAACYDFVVKCEAADSALRCLDFSDLYSGAQHDQFMEHIKEEDMKPESEPEHYVLEDFLQDTELKEQTVKEEAGNYKTVKKKGQRKRCRSKPLICDICKLKVVSPSAMMSHMRTHTGERPYTCTFCNSHYQTKGSLKKHTLIHHSVRERKFTCEMCGNSFYNKNDIIVHMRRHTLERPFKCPFCIKTFSQVASLIRHKRIHTNERPHTCPICDKKFKDKSHANRHLLVHSNEKKFKCHLCDLSVKSRSALKTHLEGHTNEKLNICNFCGMALSTKGNLKHHILRVHSEKSGQCTVCLKTFSDLQVHMWKHTGEKNFICDICSQAFGSKTSLSNHILFRHKNVAKFKCSIGECTKTFPIASMLEFHLLKQHTNHTPYVCQQCSRGFYRHSDLSRHLRVSHNIVANQKKVILNTSAAT